MNALQHAKMPLLLASLALAPLTAQATQAEEIERERMRFSIGTFNIISADTTVRFDSRTALSLTLDSTRDLGMNRGDTVARAEAYYRFNNTHSINLLWYNLKRSGMVDVSREIEIGGKPILVGANVESYLNTAIIKVGYNYSFYHSDKVELAVGGGLHITALDAGVKGELIVNDPKSVTSTSSSLTAPLPVVGLKLKYAITPTISWGLTTDVFLITINDYEGQFRDTNLNIEWRFSKHVGIGGGYNHNQLSISAAPQTDNRFALNNNLSGIHTYLFATF